MPSLALWQWLLCATLALRASADRASLARARQRASSLAHRGQFAEAVAISRPLALSAAATTTRRTREEEKALSLHGQCLFQLDRPQEASAARP